MKIRSILISVIVISLLASSAWWVSQRITIRYDDKRKLPENDIRFNPMSALEHLLLRFDIAVQSDNNRELLHNLPSPNDAIIIRNLMNPLTHERELALLGWIEQGGMLIYEPYWLGKSNSRQYFHEKLGVLIQEVENWQDISEPNHGWAHINNENLYFHISPQYVLSAQDTPRLENTNLDTHNFNDQHVKADDTKDSSQIIIQSNVGTHGIQVNHGQGSVLFLSDSNFLTTPPVWQSYYNLDEYGEDYFTDLASHDHAYFMWLQLKDRKKVWLMYENTSPAFLAIVYKNFPSLFIFSVIWLMIFFLFLLKRFGPVISSLPGNQRNLKQHIQQVGYFHWQQDKGNHLLNAWRTRIQSKVFIKHPDLAGLQDQARYKRLAELSGYTALEIKQACVEPCTNKTDFIRYTKRLKKLWTM